MLRCAYCHAPGTSEGRSCGGCRTWLHAGCWVEAAGSCPTIGCAAVAPPLGPGWWRWPLGFAVGLVTGVAFGAATLHAWLGGGHIMAARPTTLLQALTALVLGLVYLVLAPAAWARRPDGVETDFADRALTIASRQLLVAPAALVLGGLAAETLEAMSANAGLVAWALVVGGEPPLAAALALRRA